MFSIWTLNRLQRRMLLSLIGAVLALSCLLVIAGGHEASQGITAAIEQKYIDSAAMISDPGPAPEEASGVMPGVPLMMAGLIGLLGSMDAALIIYQLLQCIFHAFSVYLVFVLSRYMFNPRIAFLCCFIYALFWPAYGAVRLILPDTTMQMLMLLLVCAVIGALELKQAGWYAAAGALTAIMACYNLQALLYPLLFIPFWIKYRSPASIIAGGTLLIMAGYLLILSPWWLNIPLFNRLATYLPGPWNLASLWLDSRYIEGNPLVHLYRSIFEGRTSKYAAALGNEEARRVVQSALDAVRLVLLYAGVSGVIWSVWKYRLKRQLPVLLTLLYFITAEWLVPSLDGTGFPYAVFLLLYVGFLADKAIIYAHKTRLLRS
ncbi:MULTISPECIES: ArnT family glycosyltransferase [Paenibacillus]|uniref:ArnT family glycosyltransferase n=1 Tax=Paenibacillus TaxID=44249 RepID=UPI0004904959|nr:glycosyltransferase family 39 protein [Paenibacillus sp. IHBB 10380]